MAAKRVLILGDRGKLGTAMGLALAPDCQVLGRNRDHFEASDPAQVEAVVRDGRPDVVVNCVARLGLDECQRQPEQALRLNTLLPQQLAGLAGELGFTLVHFSTDSVFPDLEGEGFFTESSPPRPLNLYGLTKLGGDCLLAATAARHYIFRVPVIFGPARSGTQFVERLLARARRGERLRVTSDVVYTPSYSLDLAAEAARVLMAGLPFGLYHLANQGRASLYDLMAALVECLGLKAPVEPVSHRQFPGLAVKNLRSPLASEKLPPLRPWPEALESYCRDFLAVPAGASGACRAPGPGGILEQTSAALAVAP